MEGNKLKILSFSNIVQFWWYFPYSTAQNTFFSSMYISASTCQRMVEEISAPLAVAKGLRYLLMKIWSASAMLILHSTYLSWWSPRDKKDKSRAERDPPAICWWVDIVSSSPLSFRGPLLDRRGIGWTWFGSGEGRSS